ncbi:MAG: hypothetical protein AAF943_13275 [Pseudomonadota bacterium]
MAGTILLVLSGPALAQKVYEGDEALALRCANTLALTAVALESAGRLEAAEKDAMLGITIRMLDRHVSGTWGQKRAALRVMRDRRSVPDTLADYRQNAVRCLRQFPIN